MGEAGVVDTAADEVHFHFGRGIGFKEGIKRIKIGVGGIEPEGFGGARNDNRHAGVNFFDHGIGGASKDGAGVIGLARGIGKIVIECGKAKEEATGKKKIKGIFFGFIFESDFSPFIKGIGHNETALT